MLTRDNTSGSLAIERLPIRWEHLKYQDRAVSRMRRWISNNAFPPAIFVSGKPGVGKTAAVQLMVRATHCLNRKDGEDQPCGECAMCKLDPRTAGAINNVLWLQKGQEDTLDRQIKEAMHHAQLGYHETGADHRNWLFIVFDEAQQAKSKLQDLFFFPELPELMIRNRVVFVFITMDEAEINPVILDALVSRCQYLRFRPLSEEQVITLLRAEEPRLGPAAARLIAMSAGSNYRRAQSILQQCQENCPVLSEVAIADELFLADAKVRKELWSVLEHCHQANRFNYVALRDLLDRLEAAGVDFNMLIQQMMRDLDRSMELDPQPHHLVAWERFYNYVASPNPLRPKDFIKALAGRPLVNNAVFDEPEQEETCGGAARLFGRAE